MNTNAPISERVVETLKENGHPDLASLLNSHLEQLQSDGLEEREKAINEIRGMCNIRYRPKIDPLYESLILS
jgi:hypothetical protein